MIRELYLAIWKNWFRTPQDIASDVKWENLQASDVSLVALEGVVNGKATPALPNSGKAGRVIPFARALLSVVALFAITACDEQPDTRTNAERGLVYSEELGGWMIPEDAWGCDAKCHNVTQNVTNYDSDDWAALVEADDDLIAFLKKHEGFRARPYKCAAGAWTIGYGHRILPGEKFTYLTEAQAEAILVQDIQTATRAVDKYVTIRLTNNQRNALISFSYNVGVGAFRDSTLLQRLNAADGEGVMQEMIRWKHVNGEVSKGLRGRRLGEMYMFAGL